MTFVSVSQGRVVLLSVGEQFRFLSSSAFSGCVIAHYEEDYNEPFRNLRSYILKCRKTDFCSTSNPYRFPILRKDVSFFSPQIIKIALSMQWQKSKKFLKLLSC
jgi:hypothetical protein